MAKKKAGKKGDKARNARAGSTAAGLRRDSARLVAKKKKPGGKHFVHRRGRRGDKGQFVWLLRISEARAKEIETFIKNNPRCGAPRLMKHFQLEGIVGARTLHSYRHAVLDRRVKTVDEARTETLKIEGVVESAIPVIQQVLQSDEKGYVLVQAARAALEYQQSQTNNETAKINLEAQKLKLDVLKLTTAQQIKRLEREVEKATASGATMSRAELLKMIDDVMMGRDQ